MMRKLFAYSVISAALMPLVSQAAAVRYAATPEQSEWEMTVNSPLECRLVHPIPYYGQAEFSSRASKKINLDFELKMRRPMGETRAVNLVSMPPAWRPGESAERMNLIKFFKQFDGYVGGQAAWGMLSELEKGRTPTFSYADWVSRDQRIEVALSSVQFRQKYDAFSFCISQLLPYSFEDISFTILHYERNSDQLNKASQKRLAQIAEYVKHNKDIDLVLISTYTDSSGEKGVNQALSERRAMVMRDYFKSLGLDENRIEIQGYGKRRPIADNSTPMGKDKNRRVVISLGRSQV
ncbi:OmpA family protein [Vibrio sp. JC009]|uniref:flagellar protein MotY n=1 Tax=Vibrio sp. JC009 TaxID=2912314 RepID=UPI0023AFBCA7|nr:OmpA family protein [Vibrio sp. JC009]WED22552.1 OmpA family protein [Vibrio sp. JC009]